MQILINNKGNLGKLERYYGVNLGRFLYNTNTTFRSRLDLNRYLSLAGLCHRGEITTIRTSTCGVVTYKPIKFVNLDAPYFQIKYTNIFIFNSEKFSFVKNSGNPFPFYQSSLDTFIISSWMSNGRRVYQMVEQYANGEESRTQTDNLTGVRHTVVYSLKVLYPHLNFLPLTQFVKLVNEVITNGAMLGWGFGSLNIDHLLDFNVFPLKPENWDGSLLLKLRPFINLRWKLIDALGLPKEIGLMVLNDVATDQFTKCCLLKQWWNDIPWDSEVFSEIVDFKFLLMLAGDVERNPGPSLLYVLFFLFCVMLVFVALIVYTIKQNIKNNFINLSYFISLILAILFILFNYPYKYLFLFISFLIYTCYRQRSLAVLYSPKPLCNYLLNYFKWEGVGVHWTLALHPQYSPRYFPILWMYLFLINFISIKDYYSLLQYLMPIPEWVITLILFPIMFQTVRYVATNPEVMIFVSPKHFNVFLDVTTPYLFVFLTYFSLVGSWTTHWFFKNVLFSFLFGFTCSSLSLIDSRHSRKFSFRSHVIIQLLFIFLFKYSPKTQLVLASYLWYCMHSYSYLLFFYHVEQSEEIKEQLLIKGRFILIWFIRSWILYLGVIWLKATLMYLLRPLVVVELCVLLWCLWEEFGPTYGELEFEVAPFCVQCLCHHRHEMVDLQQLLKWSPFKFSYKKILGGSGFVDEEGKFDMTSLRASTGNLTEHFTELSLEEPKSDLEVIMQYQRQSDEEIEIEKYKYFESRNFQDLAEGVSNINCPNFQHFLDHIGEEIEEVVDLHARIKELKEAYEASLGEFGDVSSFQQPIIKRSFHVIKGRCLLFTHQVKMFLKSKRMKLKPVWATYVKTPRISIKNYLNIQPEKASKWLPKVKKYTMTSLKNSIVKAKEIWGISETKDRLLRPSGKACLQEPILDELAKEWKTQGANSFKYNQEEYIKSSISRYFEKPQFVTGEIKDQIKKAAIALVEHNPKLYGDAKLWSPEHILKKTVLKYSCQFPLTNNPMWKSKRDVIKNLGKPEVLHTIASYINSGHYFRSLHTVFLKLAVVNRPKIEANPSKQRTITAQDWLNYSLGMFACGSVNKRFDFNSNSAPFTPILTGGLVRLATRLLKHKYFACMDFTAADSYFSSLIEGVLEVRKLGYSNSPDFDYIANVLEAYYEGLQESVIINREQGRIYHKMRGFSTGHANTTADNTIAEQIAMLLAWRELTKRPFHEYYLYNDQPAYGDDNILGTSYSDLKTWNATNIAKFISEKLGIPCRVEWEGNSLHGATFLAKQFCTDEATLKKLKQLGIETPVAIIQDEAKLRQNFTVNLKNPNPKYIWNYCIGYLLQTSSLPHVYTDVRNYLDRYMKENNVSKEMLDSFQKMQKLPTYDEVVKMTYANRQDRKKNYLDLNPILPSRIIDAYKTNVGYICGQLQIFENLTRSLRQFIPDAPEDMTAPLFFKKTFTGVPEDYLIEAFIYYKNDAPDLAYFKELCATSPYSNLLNPEIFYENNVEILAALPLNLVLSFPHYIALSFWLLNSFTAQWWNPIGWCQYLSKRLSTFYLEANFFWWNNTGRSSATLSKLVPKDPAYYEKRICFAMARKLEKILPRVYFDIQPYKFDQTLSEFVFTVPDAPKRYNEYWDAAMPDILALLKKETHITLKARTASGKTYFLPQYLKETFPYITILTVNNVLVKSNSTPGFSKVLYTNRTHVQDQYRVMTYGLYEALQLKPRIGEIFLYDEFAERDNAIYYALKTNNCHSIAMSATPNCEGLPKYAFIEVHVPRVHKIHQVKVSSVEEGIARCKEMNISRFMVIQPNIRACQKLAAQLNKANIPATAVYKGKEMIPESGAICATTLVDSGVDIPNLEAVIDIGKSVEQRQGKIAVVDSNVDVVEQRKGRVGRRSTGYYFQVNPNVPNNHGKECDLFTYLFKPSVAETYGLKSPSITDCDEPLPPMFIDSEDELANTLNLVYYLLKINREKGDAKKQYYETLINKENKNNMYMLCRYKFKNILFDDVVEMLNVRRTRFGLDKENDVVYNGFSHLCTHVDF